MSNFPPTPAHRWVFRAQPLRVIDGDTIQVELDGGFHNYQQERLRLLGVNAPERRTPTLDAGNAARDYVFAWLVEATDGGKQGDWPLIVQTVRGDAFGRYLAVVYRIVDNACLNADLLAAGHAVEDVRR